VNKATADICAAKFDGSGDSTHETFNIVNLNVEVARGSPDQKLSHCKDALADIVKICIRGSADYGGVWKLNGEMYNITNSVYPNNPLVLPSTTSTTETPTTTPTPTTTSTTSSTSDVQGTATPNPDGTKIVSLGSTFAANGCEIDGILARQQRMHQRQR
jgi:hypothetical protein